MLRLGHQKTKERKERKKKEMETKNGEVEKGNGRDKCFAHFYLHYLPL
jgi:hypothetical protein